MTAPEESSFEGAYRRLCKYNAMPEEAGLLPVLKFGLEEKAFINVLPDPARGMELWARLDEALAKESLRTYVWNPLCLASVPAGIGSYVLDVGYRAGPTTVRVWLKLLAGELPSHPVGDQTWPKICKKMNDPEVVKALSDYYIRRMRNSYLWQERKQRWVNRNNQAVRAALKLLASTN